LKSHLNRSVILSEERIAKMVDTGAWENRLLSEYFLQWVKKFPKKIALKSFSLDRGTVHTLTFSELDAVVDQIACAFQRLEIEFGDVVSFQLENRWEFSAIALACERIGAIANPLLPVYRERELTYMLNLSEAKILIAPKSFRGFDYKRMATELKNKVSTLQHILILDDDGEDSFASAINNNNNFKNSEKLNANDLMQILFTSGTTGEPKGAMHTANTLLSNIRECARRFALTSTDVIFCPTPLAHQLGYLCGFLMPTYIGATAVLVDIWDLKKVARIMADEAATFCMGATPFLNDLAALDKSTQFNLSALRLFVSGGAPIPSALVAKAKKKLSADIISVWGITEVLVVTTVCLEDSDEKIAGTDGVSTPHTSVRVVNDQGDLLPPGNEGFLETSGATICVGYLKRPDLFIVRDEIWFETGDMARIDKDGYIRITGRAKDIIIRGGENIPVVEIEGILYRHEAITQVAIVAMHDERLGEKACAYVQIKPGNSLTLKDVSVFLEAANVAKVYHPERLELIMEMPMTATGKVQKYELRNWAKSLI
jgi:cyclohexanecarboxylate-CoA ligase